MFKLSKKSGLMFIVLAISCQVKNNKSERTESVSLEQQQSSLEESARALPQNGAESPLSELEIGIPGDDSRSESLRFIRQADGSLNVSLMRSSNRQEEQRFVNSVNLEISDYQIQTVDLLGNGRNEVLLIGKDIAGQREFVYVLRISGYNGRVIEILHLDLALGSSIDIEWEKEGFYLSIIEATGEQEVPVLYRWNEVSQRFISTSLQNNQLSSATYDKRTQRIFARDSAYMLSSLAGFWRWSHNDDNTQALLYFAPEENLMEVYISSKTGDKFLPGERSLSRFRIDKASFFFRGRISLKLLNYYITEIQRWLSIRYVDYDSIIIASSMDEPWLGSYQRLDETDYAKEVKKLQTNKQLDKLSLSGEFQNNELSLTFDQGKMILKKNNSFYRGIYVFLLHSGIHILQYRAVNREEQQKEEGLYRVEVDQWPQPQKLVLIPLSQLGQQIAGAAVLRLTKSDNA